MTKDEAQQFLEERDFCMKHLVKPMKAKGAKQESCPECDAEKAHLEQEQIEQAVRVLRGQSERPVMSMEMWTPCEPGRLPPVNERVYVMCIAFRDTARPGGKESYAVGKPLYWRRK